MKKVFLLFSIIVASSLYAQTNHFCGIKELREKIYTNDKEKDIVSNKISNNYQTNDYDIYDDDQLYVIPVVVHVLHMNGSENISDQQIYNAIQVLNLDFSASNPDIGSVIPEFQSIIGNANIEFRLARLDPNGNPTTGIDRIYSKATLDGWAGNPQINQWAPNKYLNIWTVADMNNPNVAAYAIYPSDAQNFPGYDGVVTRHNYFGVIGTASGTTRHVVGHEIGHYLNLIHTNGDQNGCTGSDQVADTPTTSSVVGCNAPYNVCNAGVIENYQNLMTGNYGCFNMFTVGQVNRMHQALNSSVAGRINLWQEQNLIDTGVYQPLSTINLEIDKITVFPVPTDDVVNFENLKGGEVIEVYNLNGKLISTTINKNNQKLIIDISYLNPSVYLVKVISDSKSKEFKVVKR